MNPHDKDPLDAFLEQWKAPDTPPHLKDTLSNAYRRRLAQRGWRWFLRGNLRVPVPFALAGVGVAILLTFVVIRNEHAAGSLVQTPVGIQNQGVVEVQKVEVPVYRDRVVIRTRYRDRPRHAPPTVAPAQPQAQPASGDYQFVAALTPRIVRKDHDNRN
jgi:hypothetical protein